MVEILLSLLPFRLTPQEAVTLMAGLAAMLSILGFYAALVQRNPMLGRAREMARRQESLKRAAAMPRRRTQRVRAVGLMRRIVERMNLLRSRQAHRLSLKLAQAGWRSRDAVVIYLFAKVALPVVALGVGLFLFILAPIFDLPLGQRLLFVAVCTFFGAYAPHVVVKQRGEKRRDALRLALPDGLDLMVICAEAGLSLEPSLKRVSRELGETYPELAEEFSLTAVELGFLPDRRSALDNLAQRVDEPGVRGLVNTLLQTERYGTPLAQALRVLSNEQRIERLMRAEEKAAKLPATMTVPLILFIFPPIFVVLVGPAALSLIDALSNM